MEIGFWGMEADFLVMYQSRTLRGHVDSDVGSYDRPRRDTYLDRYSAVRNIPNLFRRFPRNTSYESRRKPFSNTSHHQFVHRDVVCSWRHGDNAKRQFSETRQPTTTSIDGHAIVRSKKIT